MPRIAIIDNDKLKNLDEKKHIQSLCPVNRCGSNCMYFEGEKLFIEESLCTGCGICSKIATNNSIKIINLPENKKSCVIHQYGINEFRIFDLPILQKNSVTGILGQNGIGKTTVINILSNTIKANFGNFEKIDETEYFKKISKKYVGTELFNYFQKLEKKEIIISYKPQQIIEIPKVFSGEVLELLKKVNKNLDEINEISKKLSLTKILKRDIKKISGGELQRVAIASSLLKSTANFYVLDEITNYLDIFQRIKASKLIKEKTNKKTTLLVEHDLVIFDYLCDFIHLMYGQVQSFGMLTSIKPTKLGINEYLQGYSTKENIRFRSKKITFDKESVLEIKDCETFLSWDSKKIIKEDFTLEIKKGSIKKQDLIGIIGQNGIGKTTFIEFLLESLKEKKLSYKEQLIKPSENIVLEELESFENYTDSFYEIFILEPLKIKQILEKKVSNLSGGELQRFSIAKCLLQDADIYLLDEPTAFLDIEDRLAIAKTIKKFIEIKEKCAFIVDHDLIFMDYISKQLMVFLGTPAKSGIANKPTSMQNGMNIFLESLDITFRRDDANKRPRINKEESIKDIEAKKKGEYYYN